MYSNNENDNTKLNRKAAFRVKGRFFVSLLILALIFAAEYFLFHQNYYPIPQTALNQYLLPAHIGEWCLIFFFILLLATGKKWTRILYWLFILLDFLLLYFPILYFLNDPANALSYVCIIILTIIKDLELIRLGIYIFKGEWPDIFYDPLDEGYEDEYYDEEDQYEEYVEPEPEPVKKKKKRKRKAEPEEEEIFAPIKASDYRREPVKPMIYIEEEQEELPPVSKSKISLRLGLCAYGSLILFPILVQLFSKFFMSMDMKTIFAVGDIFILTMCSAVIWTIPVFFLFYEHRYANRVIVLCIVAEICVLLAYAPKFIGYITSRRYAWPVFLLFIGLNIVRYGLIGYAIAPIFTDSE